MEASWKARPPMSDYWSAGGRKVNGAERVGGGTNANGDGRFSDGVVVEEGFSMAGGIQGTTRTFNGDPEDACCGTPKGFCGPGGMEYDSRSFEQDRKEDPGSATDKGFGAAGVIEYATRGSESDPEEDLGSATDKSFGAAGEGLLGEGGGRAHRYTFSAANAYRLSSTISSCTAQSRQGLPSFQSIDRHESLFGSL
jgi:hypothetical protein